jgi:hypothetical protein
MPLFSQRSSKNESKRTSLRRDVFSRHGGRLTPRQLERYLWRVPLYKEEKEYVERVMERFHHPYSRWITREEFYKGLDEMAKNPRDPISPQEVERLKKYFEERL